MKSKICSVTSSLTNLTKINYFTCLTLKIIHRFKLIRSTYSYLCGMSKPPSRAPFKHPNTRAPVDVLASPTSK